MINTPEGALIGKAIIRSVTEDGVITLEIEDEVVDQMNTSFVLALSNDSFGIISYKAELISFAKESFEYGTYEVICKLTDFIERVQRRENFKIKVSIPVMIHFNNTDMTPVLDEEGNQVEYPAEIKDLSASGVLIATEKELEVGHVINFIFEQAAPPFPIEAKIIRKKKSDGHISEFGCKFVKMTVEKESSIRRYVFRLQLAKAASSEAFHHS